MSEVSVSDGNSSEFEESYDDDRELHGSIFQEPLKKVPTRPMVTIDCATTVAATIAAMNERHVGAAVIVRDGKLVGIFTERDVLRKVVGQIDIEKTRVEEVMTADPDTLPESASVAYALHTMTVEGYRHIPLVDAEGKPKNVVAVRDIVAWMSELYPKDILNLPPNPGYPKTVDGG